MDRLLFQLHKIGVNLNQLTRRVNSGLPVSATALEGALQATAEAARALARSE
ncbi:MAG: plasmid mobilization relaxosome protein MobC [Chloroflexota bacterium]|nr:plasmid mobilization relaxosome protein MobC [Chloroflexota bacterium]